MGQVHCGICEFDLLWYRKWVSHDCWVDVDIYLSIYIYIHIYSAHGCARSVFAFVSRGRGILRLSRVTHALYYYFELLYWFYNIHVMHFTLEVSCIVTIHACKEIMLYSFIQKYTLACHTPDFYLCVLCLPYMFTICNHFDVYQQSTILNETLMSLTKCYR